MKKKLVFKTFLNGETREEISQYYKNKGVERKYQTRDGLGEVYQMINDGKCICFGFRASCPIHGEKISIYSTSTSTTNSYEKK